MKSIARSKRNSRHSRGRRRRAVAALVFVVLAVVAVASLRRCSGRPATGAESLATVNASAAATATPAAAAFAPHDRARARSMIVQALAPIVLHSRSSSCIVYDATGAPLFAFRDRDAVMPASTLKLVVARVGLAELGPVFHFDTLLAATKPIEQNAVDGDLFLVGGGDPSLRSSDMERGVNALLALGVRRVRTLVVDGSAISGEEINPLWNAQDVNEDFNAAMSGISLDEDTVEFHVRGTESGQSADVYVNPPSPSIAYEGSVTTADGDDVTIGGTALPNHFRLSGVIPPGVSETFYLPVHGIPQYVASVVARMFVRKGIAVERTRTGTAPIDATVLWTHRSLPLTRLVRHMLLHSDNHYAEQIMRTLGGRRGDTTDAAGLAEETGFLRRSDVPTFGLHLADGSGLARANRISALTLARILSDADRGPSDARLYPLLPRGGVEGTLRPYHFTAARGRVRAKSGHLADVSSLAGYLDTRRHGRLTFAFLVNGESGDADEAFVKALDALAASF